MPVLKVLWVFIMIVTVFPFLSACSLNTLPAATPLCVLAVAVQAAFGGCVGFLVLISCIGCTRESVLGGVTSPRFDF